MLTLYTSDTQLKKAAQISLEGQVRKILNFSRPPQIDSLHGQHPSLPSRQSKYLFSQQIILKVEVQENSAPAGDPS